MSSRVKRKSEQQAENARRVDCWETVLQDLRDYMANPTPTTLEEVVCVQECIRTLHRVWDRVQI